MLSDAVTEINNCVVVNLKDCVMVCYYYTVNPYTAVDVSTPYVPGGKT